MSSFTNVTDVDLEVQVNGIRYNAKAGEQITVPDEFDSQFQYQPAWGGEEFAPAELPFEPEALEALEEPEAFEEPEEPDKKTTKAVPAKTEEKN